MLSRRRILGLAVTQQSITVAEVAASNGGGRIVNAANFPIPEDAPIDEPALLGKSLKQFLRRERFATGHCVIGMEARRLTARDKQLPPGIGDEAAGVISLAIEQEFASDRKELVFDYTTCSRQDGTASAMIVAAPDQQIQQLRQLAQAAGLTVTGITSSTMALAESKSGSTAQDRLILHLFPGGVELAGISGNGFEMVRRLSVSITKQTDSINTLINELRRIIALLPGGQSRELLVWNEIDLEKSARDLLSQKLDMPIRWCKTPDHLNAFTADSARKSGLFSAAAAIALSGIRGHRPPVDFIHSRLAPAKSTSLKKKAVWIAAAVAAVVLASISLAYDWQNDQAEVVDMERRLEDMSDNVARAREMIDRTSFARSWHDRRPEFLTCMTRVFEAFPHEGAVWATSLSVSEGMKVTFSGKAVSESAVLSVMDKLKSDKSITEVKSLYMRRSSRDRRDVSFAMSLRFKG